MFRRFHRIFGIYQCLMPLIAHAYFKLFAIYRHRHLPADATPRHFAHAHRPPLRRWASKRRIITLHEQYHRFATRYLRLIFADISVCDLIPPEYFTDIRDDAHEKPSPG
jgi:hypothetical protein